MVVGGGGGHLSIKFGGSSRGGPYKREVYHFGSDTLYLYDSNHY